MQEDRTFASMQSGIWCLAKVLDSQEELNGDKLTFPLPEIPFKANKAPTTEATSVVKEPTSCDPLVANDPNIKYICFFTGLKNRNF